MTGAQTAAASLCFLALVVAVAGLAARPSHGAGYWCLAVLWSAGWLLGLLRSRLRAVPLPPQPHPGTAR